MNYSVSHHLREPGVKQRDGVMHTRGVRLKFLLIAMQDINRIHFVFKCFWSEIPTKTAIFKKSVGFHFIP